MTAAQVAGEKDISAVKKKDKFFFNNPFGLYASFMCIDTLLHKNTLRKWDAFEGLIFAYIKSFF